MYKFNDCFFFCKGLMKNLNFDNKKKIKQLYVKIILIVWKGLNSYM